MSVTAAAFVGLVADLVAAGPTPAVRERLAAVPEYAALLAGRDGDELMADHYDVFGRGVPLFANVFLARDGMAGGEVAERLGRAYGAMGFVVPADAAGEDHLSVILKAALHTGERRAALLDAFVFSWFLPAVHAVVEAGDPLFSRVLLDLRGALLSLYGGARAAAQVDSRTSGDRSDVPSLDRSDTGLHDVAAYLTTPVRAGALLSRLAIRRAAAEADVPTGFTPSRHAALADALRDAARFERLPAFVAALQRELSSARAFYQDQPSAFAATTWIARLEAASTLLANLADAARAR